MLGPLAHLSPDRIKLFQLAHDLHKKSKSLPTSLQKQEAKDYSRISRLGNEAADAKTINDIVFRFRLRQLERACRAYLNRYGKYLTQE